MMGHSCNLSAQKADAGGLFGVKANLGNSAKLSIKKNRQTNRQEKI